MSYGFIITTYNDAEQAVEMFNSLKQSIPARDAYSVAVIDGGSTEEQKKLLQHEIGAVETCCPDLSVALNEGYDRLLRAGIDHIIWLHTDCRYHQFDWVNKLIKVYEEVWPLVGRMSPGTSNIDSSIQSVQNGEILREANSCPTLMSAKFVKELIDKYGFVYDTSYIGIGGCEDIDLWQRIKAMGYLSCICSLVDVWHHGGGIRFKEGRDTRPDQLHNREVYHKKYDQGEWNNQLGPNCEFDLSEINKELLSKFGNLKDEVISLIPERNKISEQLKDTFYKRDYNK